MGNKLAKAIKPNPSNNEFRPGIVSANPSANEVTNGTVTIVVVTTPESKANPIISLGTNKVCMNTIR